MKILHFQLFSVSFLLLFALFCLPLSGKVVYEKQDSVKIVQLLTGAKKQPRTTNWTIYFAEKFLYVPYVGGTLDKGDKDDNEQLIVNLRQLDCTTLVETVLALKLCAQKGETTFSAYCRHLKDVRYIHGRVGYADRQHYFTVWIEDNVKQAIVSKVEPGGADKQTGNHPFKAVQHLSAVNYMSTHVSSYKMLSAHREWLPGIKKMEKSMEGKSYSYIPKSLLNDSASLRRYIKDGDILVILTSKKGLDTSHIGIAKWLSDGQLHMLNASQIHKKVVIEPMTLFTYMQQHPSQLGIRVVR